MIAGFCELLLDETPPSDGRRHDLQEIHKAAEAARRLLDRMSDA